MADKYGASSGSYDWLPGFVRKWLNLDDELPNYGPEAAARASEYSPPPASPSGGYAAPSYASGTPGYAPGGSGGYGTFRPTYTPPTPSYTPPKPSYTPPTPSYTPPTPTYRPFAAERSGGGESPPASSAPSEAQGGSSATTLPPALAAGGIVQPIGYLIRAYIRGALPPQGLAPFIREARTTFTDVWKFYSYWTRFQTEELFNIGRELTGALFGRRRALESNGVRDMPRRIPVMISENNGENRKSERTAPPAPTSAPSSASPANPVSSAATTPGEAAKGATDAEKGDQK